MSVYRGSPLYTDTQRKQKMSDYYNPYNPYGNPYGSNEPKKLREVVFGDTMVVDNAISAEDFLKETLIKQLGGQKASYTINSISDAGESADFNTIASITTIDDSNIKDALYRNTTFDYMYNRLDIGEEIPPLLPIFANGFHIKAEKEDYSPDVEYLKNLVFISGMNDSEFTVTVEQETVALGTENAVFSDINKGILFKAKEGSHIYVGKHFVPFITFADTDYDPNSEEIRKIREKVAAQKEEMERIRREKDEEERTKRNEILEAIKLADKQKQDAYEENTIVVENNNIKPSEWFGSFEDDVIDVPEPEPVPPPIVPDYDDDVIDPTPPPKKTPPPEEPTFQLGSFANINDVANKHLIATDSKDITNHDIELARVKTNPDNPYVYAGPSLLHQAKSLTDALEPNSTEQE